MRQPWTALFLAALLAFPASLAGAPATATDSLDRRWPGFARQWATLDWSDPAGAAAAAATLEAWLAKLPEGDAAQGMELIVVPAHYRGLGPKEDWYNPSAELLARALAAGCLDGADSIGLALVVANSWPYAKADPATREAIVADLADHLAFYRETLDWQKRSGFAWSLDRLGFLEKAQWARRFRLDSWWRLVNETGRQGGGALGLATYREYIDRVDTLRSIAAELRPRGLAVASFAATIRNLENAVYPGHLYRHSVKPAAIRFLAEAYLDIDEALAQVARSECFITYRGETHEWQDLAWINFQWNERRLKGLKTIGDCGTVTAIQMAFCRALGIAPLSLQRNYDDSSTKVWPGTHNFPAACNPANGRWWIKQAIDPAWSAFRAAAPVEVWIEMPLPPIQLADADIGTQANIVAKTSNGRLSSLTRQGFSMAAWEGWFKVGLADAKRPGHPAGAVFDDANAPERLADSDQDGLYDSLEAIYGTSPKEWDSDGDGAADAWEIDRGGDPRRPDAGRGGSAADGFLTAAEAAAFASGGAAADDPKGDSAAPGTLDIKRFVIRVEGGDLVMSAAYWPSAPGKNRAWLSFAIRTYGEKPRDWWLQGNAADGFTWFGPVEAGRAAVSLAVPPGTELAARRDGEFRFPLAAFGPCAALQVVHWTSGDKSATEPEVCSDASPALWLKTAAATGFAGPATDGDAGELRARPDAATLADPAGDVAPGSWDLVSVTAALDGGSLLVAGRFAARPADPSRVFHTLHIQAFGSEKTNWWLQGCREWGLTGFTRFADGEPGKPFDPAGRDFRLTVGDDAEWRVPLGLFGDARLLKLRLLADGLDAKGAPLFGADATPWLSVELPAAGGMDSGKAPGPRADGRLEDLLALPGATQAEDPRGDGNARRYPDLKRVAMARAAGSLWVGAAFWNEAAEPEAVWASLELKDAAGRSWWIQGTGAYGVTNISRAAAGGSEYKQAEGAKPADSVLVWNGNLEWRLPLAWFGPGALKARLHVSGSDAAGKDVFTADTGAWFDLPGP